jgi:hypothetical protein
MFKKQYNAQKRAAKYRGIEWHFTYDTWIEWWGADITKRGRDKTDLVMARIGDTGPYHPSNVRKLTGAENSAEVNKGKNFSIDHRNKIGAANKNNVAWNKGITGPDSHMYGNQNSVKKQVTIEAL